MKTARISPLITPITATVNAPGSKSYTNRALLLSVFTKDSVKIEQTLLSDDTNALIQCLQILGAKIKKEKNTLIVSGNIFTDKTKEVILDADLSGTTMRFLLALCCIVPGIKILTGKPGLTARPIKDLVDALRSLGAHIEYLEKPGFPPIKITSSTLKNNDVVISGKISSQFVSALLMISPLIGDITIHIEGNLISKSYVAMTIDAMNKFGASVENKDFSTFVITKQTYRAKEFIVEGDYSSAAYFGAIAALTKSTITIKNLNPDSSQGDKEFFEILQKMGNTISFGKNFVTVIGKRVEAMTVDMQNCPDQIQTLAVLASFAKGTTVITGARSLHMKETNRLQALQNELIKMGITCNISHDSITILGGTPRASIIDTYNDHRMAMAFAVAACKLPGIKIKDPYVVTKTFPLFFETLKKIGIKVTMQEKDKSKIVLIGFMGAGKTSIAPLLAKRLRTNVLEMDTYVIRDSGENSIKNIFKKLGEKKFRELEAITAKKMINKKSVVISAGGGVIESGETMEHLSKNAIIVFLETSFETILNRLVDTKDRPLWEDKEKTQKLFENRQPIYKQHADIIVQTDGKSLGQITNELQEALQYI